MHGTALCANAVNDFHVIDCRNMVQRGMAQYCAIRCSTVCSVNAALSLLSPGHPHDEYY